MHGIFTFMYHKNQQGKYPIYRSYGTMAVGNLVIWGPVVWDRNRISLSNTPFHIFGDSFGIQTTRPPRHQLTNHQLIRASKRVQHLIGQPICWVCGCRDYNRGVKGGCPRKLGLMFSKWLITYTYRWGILGL